MYIEFEYTHEGQVYQVCGESNWVGMTDPVYASDPSCPKCHGAGVVKVGYAPPDEFNTTGEDIYDACDCQVEVDPGDPGRPELLDVEVVTDSGDVLPEKDVNRFLNRIGYLRLAQAAHEEVLARWE